MTGGGRATGHPSGPVAHLAAAGRLIIRGLLTIVFPGPLLGVSTACVRIVLGKSEEAMWRCQSQCAAQDSQFAPESGAGDRLFSGEGVPHTT